MEKLTQEQRKAQSRTALIEAAAHGFARHGYARLTLEQVAKDAGYTRGALYHHFGNKEELALTVIQWIGESWRMETTFATLSDTTPAESLIHLAQAHARYCQNGLARLLLILRMEHGTEDHPVSVAVFEMLSPIISRCAELIEAGRENGQLGAGPEAPTLARAFMLTIEAVVLALEGDDELAQITVEHTVRGLLGIKLEIPSQYTFLNPQ